MPGLLERLRLQGEPIDDLRHASDGQRRKGDCLAPSEAASGGLPGSEALDALAAVDLLRQRLLRDQPALLEGVRTGAMPQNQLRPAIDTIICSESIVVDGLTREALVDVALYEMVGLGPIEPLIRDPLVTDVMVNGPADVWVEREGQLRPAGVQFRDEAHLRDTVARLLAPLGRRLDTLSPYVDARLQDGSRLNVVIPPITRQGFVVTIRRFRQHPLGLDDLQSLGFLSEATAAFLKASVAGRLNLLISGGAGSGKTTLLNALLSVVMPRERIITIEDAAELRLSGAHVVGLEARPPNVEGLGQITIRQLLKNALRMRPDRLVIGEIRDASAFEFLQAINTGHAGSMCTVHANTARDALHRLENLALMAAGNVVLAAIKSQVSSALDLVIHLARSENGSRQLSEIGVVGLPRTGEGLHLLPLLPRPEKDGGALETLAQRSVQRAGQTRASGIIDTARAVVMRDDHGY